MSKGVLIAGLAVVGFGAGITVSLGGASPLMIPALLKVMRWAILGALLLCAVAFVASLRGRSSIADVLEQILVGVVGVFALVLFWNRGFAYRYVRIVFPLLAFYLIIKVSRAALRRFRR